MTCNAPLVVVDAPSLTCPYCRAANVIPSAYREELRLKRDLGSATREAAAQWLRLARIRVPRWWFISTAIAPFAVMSGGLIVILAAALLGAVSSGVLPELLACLWLILIPAQLLAANVGMKNVLVSGATNVGAAFAAIPPSAPGEPPNCRQCGAPLSVQPDDLVVRCFYCEAESVVRLDELGMETLRTRVASARSSLAQALRALMKHSKLARLQTLGRTGVIAGLLILPLVWSFLDSWNSTYWSLLIGLDVFVLSMCVFWNVREAFLPPVTMEDLEALLEDSSNETSPEELSSDGFGEEAVRVTSDELVAKPRSVAGVRGWYDNAFDAMNFIIPAVVTLIFLAIQITVLTRR